MKKLKQNKWFLLAVLVIVGLFYWFQYRPLMIRKKCSTSNYATYAYLKDLDRDLAEKVRKKELTQLSDKEMERFKLLAEVFLDKEVTQNYLYRYCLARHGIKPEDLVKE